MDYQVTLYDKSGKYRAVSAVVHKPTECDLTDKATRKALISAGTIKICQARRWSKNDLVRYNYLTAKVREYPIKKERE